MAIPGPFSWKTNLVLNPVAFTPALVAELRAAVPGFDTMGVALVDVPSAMAYASNFTKTGSADSVVKIVAMYAALYLQDRLQTIRGHLGAASLAKIESMLRKEWGPAIKSTVPRSAGDFPDITAIFESPSFDFKSSFKKDMDNMMKLSKNEAAGRCIRKIGYDYINGASTHGGLYSAVDKSGFWLASDYTKSSHPSNRDGARIPGMGTSHAASAKAAALLLMNLARDELISAAASNEMKNVMTNARSWIQDVVPSDATIFEKVGLVKELHTCGLVKHADAHYVVVTLFSNDVPTPLLSKLD